MSELKYKVGDKVRIKSLDWYNKNKDNYGAIYVGNGFGFWKNMIRHCEEIMKITSVKVDPEDSNKGYYFMENSDEKWTDEMIEGLVEEEVGLVDNFSSRWVNEFNLPDGYIFKDENGNVINATKIVLEKKPDDKLKLESTKKVREYWSEYARIYIEIYDNEPNECVLTHLYTLEGHRQKGYGRQALIEAESIAKELGCHTAYLKVETNSWMHEWYLRMGYKWYKTADKEYTWLVKNLTSIEKKKKEYPKTYEECCQVLGISDGEFMFDGLSDDEYDLFDKFVILKRCRDAYWKIAGEEMGLGKPWEPDWNTSEPKYVIACTSNGVEKQWETTYCKGLAFPTAEMRDAFYEAFRKEIEICKELL